MNIKEQEKTEKTIKEFDFWKDHSLEFLEMALKRDFQEIIKNPDGHGKRQGECGDIVEFFLIIKDNVLETISYDIEGSYQWIRFVVLWFYFFLLHHFRRGKAEQIQP